MTSFVLTEAMRAEPFVPFTIRLFAGDDIRVTKRDMILHQRGSQVCAVALRDGSIQVIDLVLIIGIAMEGEPAEVGE